ncbi:protein Daple-like protein, partial [Lates japonicus]
MDVTLSELLATFMESPLVVWVSGSSTRTHSCDDDDAHELLTSASFFKLFSSVSDQVQMLGPLGSRDDVGSEERVSMFMELVDGVFLHKIMTH